MAKVVAVAALTGSGAYWYSRRQPIQKSGEKVPFGKRIRRFMFEHGLADVDPLPNDVFGPNIGIHQKSDLRALVSSSEQCSVGKGWFQADRERPMHEC